MKGAPTCLRSPWSHPRGCRAREGGLRHLGSGGPFSGTGPGGRHGKPRGGSFLWPRPFMAHTSLPRPRSKGAYVQAALCELDRMSSPGGACGFGVDLGSSQQLGMSSGCRPALCLPTPQPSGCRPGEAQGRPLGLASGLRHMVPITVGVLTGQTPLPKPSCPGPLSRSVRRTTRPWIWRKGGVVPSDGGPPRAVLPLPCQGPRAQAASRAHHTPAFTAAALQCGHQV